MKEVYQMTASELETLHGSLHGLTEDQAAAQLQAFGENIFEEKGKKSIFCVFAEQFADLLVVILMIAAAISMISGNTESTIVIFAVILLNAVLGTVQYVKAEKSLDSLKALSSPKAKVLRDGVKKEIDSKNIVPGDLLLLEAGDMIAADGRILHNYSLQVNESALTGESANIDKSDGILSEEAALGDRVNMVFSGSLVTYGRAEVLVTATGMQTEMGRIAQLMNDTKEKKTPLQVSLDQFSQKLASLILLIGALVFGLRIWQGESVLDSLMFSVALAVAAIPEALSSIVTIVQAMGTRKMAADHAIMKELKAVESLGSVSVICSDKTGTLTQNKMTVCDIYTDQTCFSADELSFDQPVQKLLILGSVLNNDSSIANGQDIGDPTESCLLHMAQKLTDVQTLRDLYPRHAELPFDSDRKLMSSKYKIGSEYYVFTKGAVDVLLDRAAQIATANGVLALTAERRQEIEEQNARFSQNGLRVLAFAYKKSDESPALSLSDESDYIFSGLISMIDPPREESKQAVADAIGAGMKPIMITGDHKVTAAAIAKQIGIYREGDLAITGPELDAMNDTELDEKLEQISVYARVSPENKIRIVDAWQKKGKIVAMTGDGVNDAPALKKADIGVAMGITGTEVSKDAAAMILTDDNFATIIKAVANGRNVYRNIMNAVQFLLSGNMAAIFVVLYCSFMALATPFEAVHLLFINLLTDSLPALAIGMEASDPSLLKNKPRDPKEGILTKAFMMRLLGYGGLIAVVTQIAFYSGLQVNAHTASTMAFATLTLARLFHGFTCRSHQSIKKLGLGSNKWSIYAFLLGVFLLALVLFVPALHGLFMIAALSMKQIALIVLLAFLPTLLIQIGRMIKEKH